MKSSHSQIVRNFDAAALHYDQAAAAQAQIAARLVTWANPHSYNSVDILDIGSGTGLVAEEIYRRWPLAKVTAMDSSAAMLAEARRKMPQLSTRIGDACDANPNQSFDAIFCSMALHWLPQPREIVQRWQKWLKPDGKIYIALPVEGSFKEWRDLCKQHGARDGLWPLPLAGFANDLAVRQVWKTLSIHYTSAHEFLKSMKATGAATPAPAHRPIATTKMRAMLSAAAKPFSVTYELMFLEFPAQRP